MALQGHYLGQAKADNILSNAEHTLDTTFYHAERKNFNFEKYVTIHRKCHTDLNGLREFGYPGLDPRSKVCHLIAGIKTTTLDATKNTNWASEDLRRDFDRCVDQFHTAISQQGTGNESNSRNVSDVSQHGGRGRGGRGGHNGGRGSGRDGGRGRGGRGGGRGRGRGGGREGHGRGRGGRGGGGAPGNGAITAVTDRYYTYAEFQNLTSEQKGEVTRLQELRDGRRNASQYDSYHPYYGGAPPYGPPTWPPHQVAAYQQHYPPPPMVIPPPPPPPATDGGTRNNSALQRTNQRPRYDPNTGARLN